MRAHDWMLRIRELGLQRQALLDRHGGAEARLDAVARPQVGDLRLHVVGQARMGLHHVGPGGVAADGWALHATQHAAERRRVAPSGVRVPGVLIAIVGHLGRLVDAHQARVVRVAADDRMALEFAETARKGHMRGAADVLIAEEQHAMLQQQRSDLGDQAVVLRGRRQAHVAEFCADGAGELVDRDRPIQRRGTDDGRGRDAFLTHVACSSYGYDGKC